MIIFRQKAAVQRMFFSTIVNMVGSLLFSIVFIVYASKAPDAKLVIATAETILTLPYLLAFLTGHIADRIKNKVKGMLWVRIFQFAAYLVMSCFINVNESWLIFGLVLLIIFSSSFFAQISMSLATILLKRFTTKEDLARVRGFESGVTSTMELVAGPLGAILLAAVHQDFALFTVINAVSYLFSFLILRGVKEDKDVKVNDIPTEKEEKDSLRKVTVNFFHEMKGNFALVNSIPQMKHFILLFILFNLVGSYQNTLASITLIHRSDFFIGNYAFTIGVVQAAFVLGLIVGSIFPMPFLFKMPLEKNFIIEMFVFALVPVSFLWAPSVYFLIAAILLDGYLQGVSGPKLDAFLVHLLPDDKIGGGLGAFMSIVGLGVPAGPAVAGIAAMISDQFAWLAMLLTIMVGFVYTIYLAKNFRSTVVWN